MLCACTHFLQDNVITVHSSLHAIIPLTQDGTTPLFIASEHGHRDVVNILMQNGADINLARNVWRYNVPYTHTVLLYIEGSATRLTGPLMYMSAVPLASLLWLL